VAKAKSEGFNTVNQEDTRSSSQRLASISNFDIELKRLQAISNINRTLKETGADPMSLLKINSKRTFLERVSIPKNFYCSNFICRCKLSLFFMFFLVAIIDSFV
jgi:hypothetical protein